MEYGYGDLYTPSCSLNEYLYKYTRRAADVSRGRLVLLVLYLEVSCLEQVERRLYVSNRNDTSQ